MARHHMVTDQVEADLPITPMLDMSFQLLAFFIMTFHPAPTEGQIAMTLPPATEGGASGIPDPSADKPTKYIVHVVASETGTIKSMTVREEGSAAAEAKEIGVDIQNYFKELQALTKSLNGKPAKLTLEIDEKLLEAYVVQLIDHGIRAGFIDISPVPSDSKNR
ncbi:MAG TPA: biopolymer transporter ExbD [Gemmata sp.]|jgi:biopolymer transport protein ExbD|nr:biopolymer transporter ExbD [Gemmata sp.]